MYGHKLADMGRMTLSWPVGFIVSCWLSMTTSPGVCLRPAQTRFGPRSPSIEQAVEALVQQSGEVIVPNGAAAANALGLTTQVPVRSVYLTSGRSRTLTMGKQSVELRHAPKWQLSLAGKTAGQAVRALAWLRPEQAESALRTLKHSLPAQVFVELVAAAPQYSTWLASAVLRSLFHCNQPEILTSNSADQ